MYEEQKTENKNVFYGDCKTIDSKINGQNIAGEGIMLEKGLICSLSVYDDGGFVNFDYAEPNLTIQEGMNICDIPVILADEVLQKYNDKNDAKYITCGTVDIGVLKYFDTEDNKCKPILGSYYEDAVSVILEKFGYKIVRSI